MNLPILLVDDNEVQATTRKAILERAGRRVTAAPNGRIALDLLHGPRSDSSFGLIVTDHLMPVMDGPSFVAQVRQAGHTMPIVVLSGLGEAESAYAGLDVIFRLKPFPPDALIRLAQELLCRPISRSA
jgi:two-component system cell cycle sensor histidine kinase/response regulator CckA